MNRRAFFAALLAPFIRRLPRYASSGALLPGGLYRAGNAWLHPGWNVYRGGGHSYSAIIYNLQVPEGYK